MPVRALVVDDDPSIVEAHRRILAREQYEVVTASDGEEALAVLEREPVDVVITDLDMPRLDGLGLLARLADDEGSVPVIVVSGAGTIDSAVEAIQRGAVDFLQKPLAPGRLLVTVRNALRFDRLKREHEELRRDVRVGRRLIGESDAMIRLRALLAKVAPTDGRVLVLGENGTGKELVAQAIHDGSARSDRPFVKLNCAAVPAELVESELFGHEKGAFTGANAARRGRFELADGGTLFLDEIGDMPPAMQAKLLRVLQEGQLERVGGSSTISVDVCVIAATNQDLGAMVEDGSFRQDLFYRLNVVTVAVPPLRERPGDIPELARLFASRRVASGRPPLDFDDDALEALARHDFPGNVRELQNLVERLSILCDGVRITREAVLEQLPAPRRGGQAPGRLYRPGVALRTIMTDLERRVVREALEAHRGNKSATARELEVERSHFFKKLRALGIAGDG